MPSPGPRRRAARSQPPPSCRRTRSCGEVSLLAAGPAAPCAGAVLQRPPFGPPCSARPPSGPAASRRRPARASPGWRLRSERRRPGRPVSGRGLPGTRSGHLQGRTLLAAWRTSADHRLSWSPLARARSPDPARGAPASVGPPDFLPAGPARLAALSTRPPPRAAGCPRSRTVRGRDPARHPLQGARGKDCCRTGSGPPSLWGSGAAVPRGLVPLRCRPRPAALRRRLTARRARPLPATRLSPSGHRPLRSPCPRSARPARPRTGLRRAPRRPRVDTARAVQARSGIRARVRIGRVSSSAAAVSRATTMPTCSTRSVPKAPAAGPASALPTGNMPTEPATS